MGASGWAAGRSLRALPVLLALAAAGTAGFLFAQWASRPEPPAAVAAPTLRAPAPPPSAPPVTYAAPYVPPLAASRSEAPAARSSAPVPAAAAPAPRAADSSAVVGEPPVPEALAPAPEAGFALQAVTQQDGHPVAIVNGQLVRVGDVLNGARVLRIEAEAVELEKDGRRILLAF